MKRASWQIPSRTSFALAGALLITVLIALAGCSKPATEKPTAAAPAAQKSEDAEIVATVNGDKITLGDLEKVVHPQLLELERQRVEQLGRIREEGLENMIAKRLVEAEAKRQGLTPEALIKKEVADKTPAPPEAEVRKVYEQNRDKVGGRSFEQVKHDLGEYMRQQLLSSALQQYINGLRKAASVQVSLAPPEMPRIEVAADGPAKGAAGAPVTMVIFSDFECPYCAKAKPLIDQIVTAYGDKVRIVFRDFPLSIHPQAQKAAEAGHCADAQGAFWKMHDWMFGNQNTLDVAGLKKGARELGLDGDKFDKCLDAGEMTKAVESNVKAAEEAGVRATPTFFINGQLISGAGTFEQFKKVIDRELQKKS